LLPGAPTEEDKVKVLPAAEVVSPPEEKIGRG